MGLSTLGRQTGPDHKDLRRDTGPKKSPRPVFFLVGLTRSTDYPPRLKVFSTDSEWIR